MGSQPIRIQLRKILWEILAGKSCGKILRENLARKSCGKSLWENLAGNSCRKILRDNLMGKSCGKILWENLDGMYTQLISAGYIFISTVLKLSVLFIPDVCFHIANHFVELIGLIAMKSSFTMEV